MQIDVACIAILKKKTRIQKTFFHSSLLGNYLNKFQFGIVIQKGDIWNLKFSA
jgi:hypothetical protein